MTTTTKNGQISRQIKSKRRVNKPHKNQLIDQLNSILTDISFMQSINFGAVCKRLKIPRKGSTIQAKQVLGYIGLATNELRKLKKQVESNAAP